MQRIQAADALFLDFERPTSPPIIGGIFVMDPSTAPGAFVRHRDILHYIEERLHLAPNLRKRLVFHPLRLDEPRLIDDPNFDLEFHVRHIGLPRPRDRRQLNILAARLMSRPMDLSRPLWELYIIEGLEDIPEYPPDCFALMIKLHHAGFDGAAARAAIWAMMQDTPDAKPRPPEKRWTPERTPRALEWTASSLQEALRQMAANVRVLPELSQNSVRGALAGARELNSGMMAPKTRFQQPITSHRVFDWVTFQMADMQAIRAGLGKPKMNDLVLCMIGGAMRRYLSAKDELPAETLYAICPINARGAGDPKEGGNQVTAMRVGFGTHIADPIERLAYITDSSAHGKSLADAFGGGYLGAVLAFYPYMARAAIMRGMSSMASRPDAPAIANTIITNIPNPKGGHYFTGSKVLGYAGFGPPVDGFGIFHTVTGMDWELSISVTSCREIMPDIADYMACLQSSFEELRARALPPAPVLAVAGPESEPRAAKKVGAPAARRRKTAARAAKQV